MRCSTRGCPYPTVSRSGNLALCDYHMRRLEPLGNLRCGTVTVEEHNAWCKARNIEAEEIAREHRHTDRLRRNKLTPQRREDMRDMFIDCRNTRKVAQEYGVSTSTVQRYTKDLRGPE